jgi:hypothetical protein
LQALLGYSTGSDAYVKLQLSEEESLLVYNGLRALPIEMGTRESAIVMNLLVRITEQVLPLGQPPSSTPRKKPAAKIKKRG